MPLGGLLLQRMEEYRGLAVLCTNRRSALDRAFLRRLRFLVEFPPPDWAHRRLIWQKVFPPRAPRGELDLDALSRLEISGANIRNIALNAAFLAARRARWGAIVSARSGESEDVTIIHLAVGWGAKQLKVGSFARSERMAKWNEGLRIADALGGDGPLPPRREFPWG